MQKMHSMGYGIFWVEQSSSCQVLGIMGALDPYVHKRNQQNSSGVHGEVARAASDTGQHIRSMEEFPTDLGPSFATSEDYYATVYITKNSIHFGALFFIFIFYFYLKTYFS